MRGSCRGSALSFALILIVLTAAGLASLCFVRPEEIRPDSRPALENPRRTSEPVWVPFERPTVFRRAHNLTDAVQRRRRCAAVSELADPASSSIPLSDPR